MPQAVSYTHLHLTVEVHTCLELAHRLHTAHVLVLSDEYWLVLLAQSLNLYKELSLLELSCLLYTS